MAAAGSGQRLGAGGPKAFVELCGRPLLEWSLIALADAETIESIVIAAPPGRERAAERSALRAGAASRAVAVSGGATRAESVARALVEVESEIVAIHDAARPLVDPELVDRLVRRLAGSPRSAGVIAAAPLADTVKTVGADGAIAGTIPREKLWAAQTPQVFRTDWLRRAQAAAVESGRLGSATDEAQLLEWAGSAVLAEPVREPNLKVTSAADLGLAASILGDRLPRRPPVRRSS